MAKKSTTNIIKLKPAGGYDVREEQNCNAVGRRIAQLREEQGLSLAEFSDRLQSMGLSLDRSTIGKWEKGHSTPNAYQLIAVSKFFGVDSTDCFTSKPAKTTLNTEGMKKLESYREDLVASGNYRPQPITVITGIRYRTMRIAEIPVSAGPGAWLDSDNFEEVQVPEDMIPDGAEFGVRISGRSMEPVFHDGQIAWVQQCATLEPGEVGVMVYDGEGYIKRYDEQDPEDPEVFTDGAGVVHKQPVMVSFNPEFKPRPITPSLGFFICGRVLR